ncbi:MAG: 5-oxoprolinase subunit PxpB [Bacteroidetes bacterium]|nr:5-oxoprolinase subunit PxpB [Bacteroidota bacterium]
MDFLRSGDSALFVRTGNNTETELSASNKTLADLIIDAGSAGIIESVSSYTGVMVYFDPLVTSYDAVRSIARTAAGNLKEQKVSSDSPGLIIPVAYGGDYGPDLQYVADHCSLTRSEVASIHSSGKYTIHLLGFTPGFPYMGGMDPGLSTPRKKEPAINIQAGSVGIAGDQTGIYPVDSPGGWQIIGRTPLILFDQDRDPAFLLKAGMRVRFRSVDNYEFWHICELINNDEYEPETFG